MLIGGRTVTFSGGGKLLHADEQTIESELVYVAETPSVAHLGETPEQIALLLRGGGQQALSSRLTALTYELEQSATQTDAYPVLEYSHASDPRRSFSRAVVMLGELTLLLEYAIDREESLPAAVWHPLRCAVELIMAEKYSKDFRDLECSTDLPDLDRLASGGLHLLDTAEAAFADTQVCRTRSQWNQWLCWHGRSWASLRHID